MTELLRAAFKVNYPDFNFDIDLQLPASGITVVFGPSGSGKTTLLRCLAGLEKTGKMEIAGQVWQDQNLFIPLSQRAIGIVFQESRLFPHLKVRENLLSSVIATEKSAKNVRVSEILSGMVGLKKRKQ